MENMVFKGKKAVVLGGTKGIGLELSRLLSKSGASVKAYGRTALQNEENLIFRSMNFEEQALNVFNDAELTGDLEDADILAFVYGPFIQKPLHETTATDWEKMALLNYALPGTAVSKVLSGMKKRNFGRIVLFGGTRTNEVRGYKTNASYAGAKTGLSVLVESVAKEYEQYGITCNAILPGFAGNAPEERFLVSEKELADKAYYVLCNECLNGVLLKVDKGWNPK